MQNALIFLNAALCGFYDRRKTDPFAGGLITRTKELTKEALNLLDEEII